MRRPSDGSISTGISHLKLQLLYDCQLTLIFVILLFLSKIEFLVCTSEIGSEMIKRNIWFSISYTNSSFYHRINTVHYKIAWFLSGQI